MDMTSTNVNVDCSMGLEVLRLVTGLFMCPVCCYESERLNDVQRHMVTHSNEPPKYECEICGHRMHQKSNMKSHLAAHKGDRPQKCPDSWIDDAGVVSPCHAAFTDPSALSKHRGRHHGKGDAPARRSAALQRQDKEVYALAIRERITVPQARSRLGFTEKNTRRTRTRTRTRTRARTRARKSAAAVKYEPSGESSSAMAGPSFVAGPLDLAPYRFEPSPHLKRTELPPIASIGSFESVGSVKHAHVAGLSFNAPAADASLLFNNIGFGTSFGGGYSGTSFDRANMGYSFESTGSRFGCSLDAPAPFAAPAPASGWQQHLQQQQLQAQSFVDVMDEPNFLLPSQVSTQYFSAPMDFVVPTGGDFFAPSGCSAGPGVPQPAMGWGMSEWELGFVNPSMATAATYMPGMGPGVKSNMGMDLSLGAGTSTRTAMDAGVGLPPAPLSSDVPALPPMDPLCGQPSVGWDAYYGPGAFSGSPSGASSNASSPSTMGMTFDDFLRYAA